MGPGIPEFFGPVKWGPKNPQKFYKSLKIGPHFFLQQFKTEIISNFVKFVATQKVMTTNFFSPLSFVAVFGSRIWDPGWLKIRIPDPG